MKYTRERMVKNVSADKFIYGKLFIFIMETNMEEKTNNTNPVLNLLRTEWGYLRSRKKFFIISMTLFVIAALIELLNPWVIGEIFNSVQKSITNISELYSLIWLISLLLILNIAFWCFHGVGRYVESRNGFYVNRNYINTKIKQVLELPVKWHKDHHSGDTIDKINRAAGGINAFSGWMTFQIAYAIINIFGSLAILFFIDYRIALFALVYSVVVLYIMFRVDKKLTVLYAEQNKKGNRVSAAIYDYIGNILTIITLRMRKTVSTEVDKRIMASNILSKKTSALNEMKWGIASIAITLMTVLALIFKAYDSFVGTGVLLVGTLYMLYGYLNTVGRTFYSFAELYGELTKNNVAIKNAEPIEEAFKKIEEEVSPDLPENWKEVELKNIHFSYESEAGKKHLDGVDFKFAKGQKIALVGESGSGKSTILSLLRGLYPPISAKVLCDGKMIDQGLSRIKKHVTLIPQDPELFNNTIEYNITMDIETEKKELDKFIKIAQFRKVVDRLDKGLETNVLERGVSLSGGEKQRLALARGLLAAKDSDIVLLDEPTSSVDSINEMAIHDNIFEEFRGKTIISSIHRLHLLKKFDYVYMFDKGKVVAQGTLDEIKRAPRFMAVWRKYGLTGEMG